MRCFTCGKPIVWGPYSSLIAYKDPDVVLDIIGIRKFCCRRMYIGHNPELEKKLLMYKQKQEEVHGK